MTYTKIINTLAVALLFSQVRSVNAQGTHIVPASAHVNLFFPHLANDGPPEQQWQMRLTFTNPTVSTAQMELGFFNDGGVPLSLDLGTGSTTQMSFSIPPFGTRVFRSRVGSNNTTITGWALAVADVPVQATLAFRTIENGRPGREVNAEPTLPSAFHLYPANAFMGLAVANVLSIAVNVDRRVRDSEGKIVAQDRMTIPPNGHSSFTLLQAFPDLGTAFEGSLELSSALARPDFVAWALASDSAGVFSSLPSGRYRVPASHFDEIWLAFRNTLNAASLLAPDAFRQPVELRIAGVSEINAGAGNGAFVQINLALAELISDSPSELAFVVAHELGHIYQQRTGRFEFDSNAEKDADLWGLTLSLTAGYDVYAAAGALSIEIRII